MRTEVFRILGMDCAEEVAILKRELGPLVGGEQQLSFDMLNAKMTVQIEGTSITVEHICSAIEQTGMRALTWEQHINRSSNEDSLWSRYGQLIMCISSGIFIVIAFLFHTNEHGFIDALSAADERVHVSPWHTVALYVLGIITGGWFIFPKALAAIRRLRPDMHLLMAVAVFGACAIGEWFEAAAVTFLFGVAQLLESWSVGRARRAIRSLMELAPTTARFRVREGEPFQEGHAAEVPIDAVVEVRPGEKIPLDGVVTKGRTAVNQAPITGESMPVSKQISDVLFAGTINGEGAIEFRVTKRASDTTLSRIIRMVEEAQSRRAPSEQWVEMFARYYTPAMMLLAAATAILPPLFFLGSWNHWVYQSLVLLVIACPCALVISTPVSIVAGLSSAARAGVLVKGGLFLEQPAHIKAIALDKTGTLTRGQPEVQHIAPLNEHTADELLERAAALEANSEHPLAQAILRTANERRLKWKPAEGFQAVTGRGAEALIDGRLFWIGSHRFLHEKGMETPDIHQMALEFQDAGHSVVVIGNDRHVCGLISVADSLRSEAPLALSELKALGIHEIVMLTGDNKGTASAISKAAGVDAYKAELLPEEKVKSVAELVAKYQNVAMIGDGVNDAPALAAASLGIAMGAAGSDAAIETADIALMSDDLSKLPWLVRHSRRTLNIIKQNIFFSLGIKGLFIVLTFLGFATLWMAIAADAGASLLVIFNGLRLLRTAE